MTPPITLLNQEETVRPKVLIAEDDISQRLLLRMSLESEYEVLEASDGAEALYLLSEEPAVRLLITDLAMPKVDGFELIEAVRRNELRYTYIIVLTGTSKDDSLYEALSRGADDYLLKPVRPDELKLRLLGGTRLLRLESHEELIFSMAKMADYRSEETGFHLERVLHYTRLLARDLSRSNKELGLTRNKADEIANVSPLHDLGKVAIPDSILHKPGRLDGAEMAIMRTHTTLGGNLIKEIYDKTGSPYLLFAHQIAMSHHERWDGTGYPMGLKERAIPLAARALALADVYDAMTSKRCYKDAVGHQEAKEVILAERGRHFDPKVVDAFLRQEKAWLAVKERFKE